MRLRFAQRPIRTFELLLLGDDFNRGFVESFMRHHYALMEPVNGCMVGPELTLVALRCGGNGTCAAESGDIDEMPHELERHFNVYDYQSSNDEQPFVPMAADIENSTAARTPARFSSARDMWRAGWVISP